MPTGRLVPGQNTRHQSRFGSGSHYPGIGVGVAAASLGLLLLIAFAAAMTVQARRIALTAALARKEPTTAQRVSRTAQP